MIYVYISRNANIGNIELKTILTFVINDMNLIQLEKIKDVDSFLEELPFEFIANCLIVYNILSPKNVAIFITHAQKT